MGKLNRTCVEFIVNLVFSKTRIRADRKLRVAPVGLAVLLLFTSSPECFAFQEKDGVILTKQSDLDRLKVLLKGTANDFSPEQFRVASNGFASSQLSHTLRLTALKQVSVEDPEFQKLFPEEARILSQHPESSVRLTLTHDAAKNIEETKLANEGLVRSQGLNYRELKRGIDRTGKLTPDQARELGSLIENRFINDVNVGEYRVVTRANKLYSPNPEFSRVHSLMTAVEDWYDAAKNRPDIGAHRKTVVQWIEFLEKNENAFEGLDPKDIQFMKDYGAYLEKADPLTNKADFFKKVSDIGSHANVAEYKKAFQQRGDELAKQALKTSQVSKLRVASSAHSEAADGADSGLKKIAASSASEAAAGGADGASSAFRATGSAVGRGVGRAANAAGGVVKGAVVGGAAVVGVKYAFDPEGANWTDTLATMSSAAETSACQTFTCVTFINQCRSQLNLPSTTALQDVLSHKRFGEVCVAAFFRLPLNQQAEQRQDADLDHLLMNFAPSIRNLVCSPLVGNKQEIEVEFNSKNEDGVFEKQSLIYDMTRTVQRVDRIRPDTETGDYLICSNSKPQMLQHCSQKGGSDCENYDIDRVRHKNLYHFVSNRNALLWARQSDQMVTFESAQIHKCCANSICHQYFTKRSENYARAEAKSRQVRLPSDQGFNQGSLLTADQIK